MKSIKILAVAGLVAGFGASEAFAWSGDIIKCNPTPGKQIRVSFSGLSCLDAKTKLSLKTSVDEGNSIDGCVANVAAPLDEWAAGKWAKVTQATAATITQADIKLKGTSFGSCDLTGSDVSAGANGSGEVKFLNSAGDKITSSKFFGTVAGDASDVLNPTATTAGIVTKGFGIGGTMEILAGFSISDPDNGPIVQCSAGATCTIPEDELDPLNVTPATVLDIQTTAASYLLLSLGTDDPNDPNDYDALP